MRRQRPAATVGSCAGTSNASPATAGCASSDRIPVSSEQRILVVDDDRLFADFLVEFLGNRDINAVACYDGFAAGRRVESFGPDIMLLDLMMPGMDGIEVCRELKADKATRHVRVLAMTGYPSDANRNAILGAGAEVCLAKPLDHDHLLVLLGSPARPASATG